MSYTFYIVPVFISFVLLFGLIKRVDVFSEFIAGAKDGLSSAVSILPALVALLTAVAMLRASGVMDILISLITPLAARLGFPPEVLPGALMRPVSGAGSLAMLESTLATYGTDSTIGRIAAVVQGSTETTFYTLAVYFGAVGIKKTGNAMQCALTADFVGFVGACLFTRLFFG